VVDLDKFTAFDQVWATDVTYLPLRKRFLYLVAMVDLFSTIVLSGKLSDRLEK
jgi:putative transposase